jgi:DNA-binding beta-propeller fold protein YncE/ABC-type Fe3+ transport system permease subunit
MRGSGWVLPGLAALLWLAAVGYPALALGPVLLASPAADSSVRMHSAGAVLATSLGWALAVAVGAVLVGWAPGRLLGRVLPRRGYLAVAALMLAPICLPSYVVFYAWWQSWPPDTALHEWAVTAGRLGLVKMLVLYLGLLCWSWPLVAWCTAGAVAADPAQRQEMLRLDGAGPLVRLTGRLRADARGLAIGGLIVFLFVLNNTSSFDIAQIYTFGFELVALDQLAAGPRALMAAGAPAIAIGIAGALAIWLLLGRGRAEPATRPGPVSVGAAVATAVVWTISAAVPMMLFAANLSARASASTFLSLYGADLANTIGVALIGGLVAAVAAVGLAATWQDHRRWVRRAGDVQAVGWLVAAVVPGVVVAVAGEAAWNRPGLDALVYHTPAILVLGYLARYAFVGALLARWMTLAEPRVLGDLRRLDGAVSLAGWLRATWPSALAVAGASFAVVAALSMSELAVTSRLQPRGFATIAQAVLHAVHYQRPDTVMLATIVLIGVGLAAGFLALGAWWPLRRWGARVAIAAVLCVVGPGAGCRQMDPDDVPPLKVRTIFGGPGRSLGQFQYPRGVAVDAERKLVYVVDKTARVQRFDFDGKPRRQWRMPAWDNGKPTGLGVSPEGHVVVADTHYHRVIVYDADGNELLRFGRYGQGPGEFIYPTDVAFGPEGHFYVSEYGGNERVGVFTAAGEFLFSFGGPGAEVGRYNRPQALAFSADFTELYIADACNHRIVVTDPQGTPLRVLGGPGRGPGRLAYPYDVMVLRDGSLLVCEFGNNRLQRLSPEGECLGLYGRLGTDEGELQYPWGVDGTEDAIFVVDSGNNRVQVVGGGDM